MSKIIIVDDEKWTRETIKQFGKWEQFNIEIIGEAGDGQEALRLIEQFLPDIVITDMKMPGVDGIELLQIVTERFPQIKLIVVSGYDDFKYMRQAIRSKVNEYLLKPVNSNELNLALDKCTNEIKSYTQTQQYKPITFTSKDISAVILEYKKTINSYLQELNMEGFEKVLQRFFDEFKCAAGFDNNVHAKIEHEFILTLEQQMLKNDCNVTDVFEKDEDMNMGVDQTLDSIMLKQLDLGKRYIEYMINLKKRKSRVNLQEIKDYIDRNFADSHISLEVLANRFFVSKEYLSKTFKGLYGCNITEYIVSCRIEYAKNLLQGNEFQIKNIAQMVGYEDISYFYRVFKKYFKISPGEMRQS
jgi:two-component system response regulator YesN